MSLERKTVFSPCRKYRYTLWRDWSDKLTNGNFFTEDPHLDYYPGTRESYLMVIGLNPSTADEKQDDPTIRRCISFAKAWGFGALCMTNLFAFRATMPRVMKMQPGPVGEDNNDWLLKVAQEAGLILCAWGNHGAFLDRATSVKFLLQGANHKLHCFRLTGEKQPEHPLYLPANTLPTPMP